MERKKDNTAKEPRGAIMVNTTNHSLAVTLFKIFQKSEKNYIVPAIDSLISLLGDYHGCTVKRRRVFYSMRYLLDEKLIRRKARYQKYSDGQITQVPSMVTWTLKGLQYLWRMGVGDALKSIKRIKEDSKKRDQRFPRPQEVQEEIIEIDTIANLVEVKRLIAAFT